MHDTTKKRIIVDDAITDAELKPVGEPEPFSDDDEIEYQTPKQNRSAAEAADALRTTSNNLVALYARYASVHALAREFNGLPESDPLPDGVEIAKITFVYKTPSTGGNYVSADIVTPQNIGEFAGLLHNEIERLVDEISDHLANIREVATATEYACNQAKLMNRLAQSKNVPS